MSGRYSNDGLHRRSGIWYFGFRGDDGLWHERSTRTQSYDDARRIRSRFMDGMRSHGAPVDRARWKFADAADYWMEKRCTEGLDESTLQIDRERLVPLKAYFGEKRLEQLSGHVLLGYKRTRLAKVKPRTFNMERRVIRAVLRDANLWHQVERDFASVHERSLVGRAMEPEAERYLHRAARANKERFRYIYEVWRLSRHAGLRKKEMLTRQLGHLDMQRKVVIIDRVGTKTMAGAREVQMNDAAWAAAAWLRMRARALRCTRNDHYLLPADMSRRGGKGYDPTKPQKTFRTAWRALTRIIECPGCHEWQEPAKLCSKCARDISKLVSPLAGFRFHDNRHTFRSDLADADVDTETARELMGWESNEMDKVYRHIRAEARTRRDKDKRKAVDAVFARALVASA